LVIDIPCDSTTARGTFTKSFKSCTPGNREEWICAWKCICNSELQATKEHVPHKVTLESSSSRILDADIISMISPHWEDTRGKP
jgi:hypothetical protein